MLTLASRALDRCAAQTSTWTRHTVVEQVTRLVTEHGVRAIPAELRDLVELATGVAVEDCLSVLPPGAAKPEHVAHLTSISVVAAEMRLRDLLTSRTSATKPARVPDVTELATKHGLDDDQARAAGAAASTDPLVIVEGAAGAGKTTMLAVAIAASAAEGRATLILTPTKKAADVAARELGVPAESVAKLLHTQGWRLPVGRAVQFIEAGRVQALKREHAVANRRSRLDLSEERRLERPDPAPGLGL